jgi:hypothetical protein
MLMVANLALARTETPQAAAEMLRRWDTSAGNIRDAAVQVIEDVARAESELRPGR